MYHSLFIHLSVDGHLGCFHVLAIVYSTAMNIGYMCLFQLWFSVGYILSGGIVGSYDSFVPVFFFF